MIVYTKTCLPCTHRQQWRDLRQFARQRGITMEQRRITHKPEWRLEAESYGIALPFIVNGDQVISLNEPLERLEK